MNKEPRRRFLKQLGMAGASATLAPTAIASSQWNVAEACSNLATTVIPLENWMFALDPAGAGESQGWFKSLKDRPSATSGVSVPHTWQVSTATADHLGVGWYWTEFDAPAHWAGQCMRIEFEAVFHTAKVWLNGKLLGEHRGRGYTAFTLDAAPALQLGSRNLLAVKVDNTFQPDLLPRNNSYDWAPDGGITRPVSLLVTPIVYLERLWIDAVPDLDAGHTPLQIRATVRNADNKAQQLTVSYDVVEEGSGVALARIGKAGAMRLEPMAAQEVTLSSIDLPLKLWHFDHPQLYRVIVQIWKDRRPLHSYAQTFGSRKFEVRDTAFYLNGERVWLMGVERMAGSNPQFGMAEPSAWITHDHDDLKELNCVFTRVHWQQDKRVLDYCDRHGILFQEEVPSWGGGTFKGMTNEPSPEIMQNGLEQLREMISRDGNHPSIVSWGLCNEVNGHNPVSRAFIQQMAKEARRLDPHRLLTYASNSLQQTPGEDAAGLLDFIEWNEYYESWYPGNPDSVRRNLQQIHEAFPHKPVVISEYGYCECRPDRLGGDARRIEIMRDHNQACREFDFVAGTIFFDYNDYRTHIGDKGVGSLKQRVHGVVDLYGNRKPSFDALRQEASPVESLQLAAEEGGLSATVTTRRTLPAYTLEGYTLRWLVFGFDDLPMEEGSAVLPKLTPGQKATLRVEFQEKHPTRVRVDVLRPTGFSAATAWWPAGHLAI
jgi:beta-glucuronidase